MALTMVLVKPANEGASKAEEKVAYKTFFNNTGYLGNVLIYGACSGAFFAYLTLWPIVMEQHGYEADAIGLSFIPQTIMFIVGGYASKLLIRRVGSEMTLKLLLALFGLCVLAIALATLVFKAQTIYPLLIAFSVLAAANGAIYPIVVNSALQHFSQCASKAAGLQNFYRSPWHSGHQAWLLCGPRPGKLLLPGGSWVVVCWYLLAINCVSLPAGRR